MKNAKTWRVDFSNHIERAAQGSVRAGQREVKFRNLKAEGRYYIAVDADHLLSSDDAEVRPGHPVG